MTRAPSQLSSRPDLAAYRLYGRCVAIPREFGEGLEPLSLPPDITIHFASTAPPHSDAPIDWYHTWRARDGSCWLSAGKTPDGWYCLRALEGEFRVSPDGRRVQSWLHHDYKPDELRHRLLNQVLPMILNHIGSEVLHASSVCSKKGALAFVGNGGYGKSTLAAGMIEQGCSLLSDDAVPLWPRGEEVWTSHGPAEMGLWSGARPVSASPSPDNGKPTKERVKLAPPQHRCGDFPLFRLYFLQPSSGQPRAEVRALASRDCLMELVRATHRMDVTDEAMLRRQTNTLRNVARCLPAGILTYPSGLPDRARVIEAVLSDLEGDP